MGRWIILTVLILLFSCGGVTAEQLFLLYMKSGGTIKCTAVKETTEVVMCDADGVLMTIPKSTIKDTSVTQGALSKTSPQIGPRSGGGRGSYRHSSIHQDSGSAEGYQTTPSIKSACTKEWGTDYRMIEYCVKKQTEAKSNLDSMR